MLIGHQDSNNFIIPENKTTMTSHEDKSTPLQEAKISVFSTHCFNGLHRVVTIVDSSSSSKGMV